jgi:hypothetical protein
VNCHFPVAEKKPHLYCLDPVRDIVVERAGAALVPDFQSEIHIATDDRLTIGFKEPTADIETCGSLVLRESRSSAK